MARKKTEWDERLMCGVERLSYDFATRKGVVVFPRGDCCDFRGCLRLFEAIDPGVVAIDTWSGDRPDTIYRKRGGTWESGRLLQAETTTEEGLLT